MIHTIIEWSTIGAKYYDERCYEYSSIQLNIDLFPARLIRGDLLDLVNICKYVGVASSFAVIETSDSSLPTHFVVSAETVIQFAPAFSWYVDSVNWTANKRGIVQFGRLIAKHKDL